MDTAEAGRMGGLTRAKRLSSEERRASALKASRAAAKARSEKAKLRRQKELRPSTNLSSTLKQQQKRKRNRKGPLSDLNAQLRKSR